MAEEIEELEEGCNFEKKALASTPGYSKEQRNFANSHFLPAVLMSTDLHFVRNVKPGHIIEGVCK